MNADMLKVIHRSVKMFSFFVGFSFSYSGDFHYYSFLCIIWCSIYFLCFSYQLLYSSALVVFFFFFLFSIFKFLVRIFMVFFSCLFFSSSVSIIITNSSESLPSTLYTSVFWLFCQRLSRSLSMETSPTVFPFFSVQFSCSAMSNAMQPHDCSMPGLTVHHQLPEFTQTRVH